MIKIMCDICGKEIQAIGFLKPDIECGFGHSKHGGQTDVLEDQKKFNISTCGRKWDLCDECQADINIWLTNICRTKGDEHAL